MRNGNVWRGAKEESMASTQPIDTEITVTPNVKMIVVQMVLMNVGSAISLA